ncbi:MAG: N-acetylmuramoyl-L-alanine amidase [Bacteroidales bacterium]|nr:N-acetylmuramoyl-L-alanine amidase [Bacteroidales bacterium]
MSNSPLATYKKISPFKNSPRKHVIDTVTIHCVVGQCSVETLGRVFSDPNNEVSANYGIGPDGRIGLYVDEGDRSWCSSSGDNDHRAITIEVASDTTHPYAVTDAAYKALLSLLTDICMRNNIKKLLWKADKSLIGQPDKQNMTVHRWFANKACPGEYLYSRHAQIAAAVNERLAVYWKDQESEEKPSIKPLPTVNFQAGDLVSIRANATYYNGSDIPNWVRKKKWYVKSVSGDRVVINKSEDGKNAINSPVSSANLLLVKAKPDVPYLVKVSIPDLNIRCGPGTNFAKTGVYTGKGIFTIVEVKSGQGSKSGWGKLKSGAGWISLDYATKV